MIIYLILDIFVRFRGDYRSGRRLNMRRLIPFIASGYRKDAIWLRRTRKDKRDYNVMIALDDSASMRDHKTMMVRALIVAHHY